MNDVYANIVISKFSTKYFEQKTSKNVYFSVERGYFYKYADFIAFKCLLYG